MNALLVSHPHYLTRFAPPHLPLNERFAGFTKCSKSPTPLPPLEKGEVAWQHCKTVILHHLHFVIYRTVSKIAILLPSRRWGLLPIRTINEIFRTIPRPTPTPLPFNKCSVCFASALSLALHHHPCLPCQRWGGLTAKHKLLSCCILLAIYPPFLFTKPFRRQDGGIAFLPHPFPFSDSSANNPSIVAIDFTFSPFPI